MDTNSGLILSLVPASGDASDSAWQDECRAFLTTLKADSEVEAAPLTGPTSDGNARSLSLKSFSDIALTVIGSANAGAAASRLWDLLNAWLKRRHGCRCVIKTRDGSEFVFNQLSKEEAVRMLSAHLRRMGAQSS